MFFNPASNDEFKAAMGERLLGQLRWVNEQLEGKTWLMGQTHWPGPVALAPAAGLARVAARPALQAAMQAEGL